jgi:nucleotide-binding universal stress UspA family protein
MMTILICYDGSSSSEAAIDRAGELFAGQPAIVLTVWEGFSEVLARAGSGIAAAPLNFEEIDAAGDHAAHQRAEQGTARARLAGLQAEPRVAERRASIWATILEQARRTEAGAVVLGSRGLTGVRSILLGSVSRGVLHHADRPVVVVPSPPMPHQ